MLWKRRSLRIIRRFLKAELQSNQAGQDSIHELLIWKVNPFVASVLHQSIPPAPTPPTPQTTAGHLPALSVPGLGHWQILHCPGAGHLPTPGPFPSFDTHAVCYQNQETMKGTERASPIYRIYSINRPGHLLNFCTLRVGAYSRLGAY